ncbi:MAG: NAD-dependent protein deacylase [Candidatus Methanospirareceae archaeon]
MVREELLTLAARMIATASRVVAFTGAGISVESGIAPFRGSDGLWETYDPAEYAHINTFRSNPEKAWILLKEMLATVSTAEPNAAHRALAELEHLGKLRCIVTQNVDSLHQRAGSSNVVEFHGCLRRFVCLDCARSFETEELMFDLVPLRCACGGLLKPDVIFFGEPIPTDTLFRAESVACTCDAMLVIGTSAIVQPAASLPLIAWKAGAKVIEVNTEPTTFTALVSDYFLAGDAGEILQRMVAEVRRMIHQEGLEASDRFKPMEERAHADRDSGH